jgi:hypothetical protein
MNFAVAFGAVDGATVTKFKFLLLISVLYFCRVLF